MPFVPDDFEMPVAFEGTGYHLEPLAPVHNQRDHDAWMSSIDHIKATPGFEGRRWPEPMTLEENLADMEMHWGEFDRREAATYSVLDGDEVVGCVYLYPDPASANGVAARSWVRASRADLDEVLWREMGEWLATTWPFDDIVYSPRL